MKRKDITYQSKEYSINIINLIDILPLILLSGIGLRNFKNANKLFQ